MQQVATLAALSEDRGLRVEIGEEKILLVRDGDAVRAYSAICPHAGGPLEEGAVCNGRIVCPWHKGTFRVSDGALLEPPPLDRLARYPVRVEGENIFISPIKTAEPPKKASAAAAQRTLLIAGAGAAGGAAALALREFGFDGRILMVGREPGLPFDRTCLSKFVVAAEMAPDDVPPLCDASFYDERRIERIEAEVQSLDVAQRRAALADGRALAFDAALIATGGVPKRLDIPGADLQGVHVLRTRQDAAAILADLRGGARAIILGASFIGLEVASGLRAQNIAVSVVWPESAPFVRQFGKKIGESLRALHEANGVAFHPGARAARLEGAGRVETVVLEDGSRLPADLVVIGVGVRPATDFVQGVARGEDGGLAVDAAMRVAEGVYAAGDVAAFPLTRGGRRARIEHWRVAQQQARVAARNMMGGSALYDGVPFFWTYHYGKNFEYLGHADAWQEEIILGDLDHQDFVALLVRDKEVSAVVACAHERQTAILAERMRNSLPVDEAMNILGSI